MLHPAIQDMLTTCDDQSFCDYLLSLLSDGDDREEALRTLHAPWVLQRLRQVKTQAAHVYFGSFLGPARRLFPGQIFPAELLEAMRGVDAFQEGTVGDVPAETWRAATEKLYRQGCRPGMWPGWTNVAQHYTVRRGEMTIITGIASHMKSSWVQALCVNLARAHRWRFGMFSPEHAPVEELAACLLEHYTGVALKDMPEEMFLDTLGWVMEHFHCIAPPEEVAPTLPYLLTISRHQVEQYGIQGLVLDPWNEIDHQYGRQAETQYISESLSKIRRFARHHQVHVWVVAHPAKMQRAVTGPYQGKYPPPKPYDISGSANWFNKADNCICIWRDIDEDSTRIEVHVQKVRYRAVGKPGMVELELSHGHFIEDAPEDGQWHY